MSNFILTITGADDAIDPKRLVELSKKYEFVEWGILFSATAAGTDRYPSMGWRTALYAEAMSADVVVNLSAHLCGRLVDERLASRRTIKTEVETFFRRVQFNRYNYENAAAVADYSLVSGTPVIVPYNTKTAEVVKGIKDKGHISVLFDASGGRGVVAKEWPDPMPEFFCCGYAGGLTENNIDKTLEYLAKGYDKIPFWVDLETGARTDDNKFDLDKVERILEIASKYYGDQYEPSRIILLS